jgi:hypothetical protein
MFNLHGIGVVVPFYYFVHYILTPISAFKAADMRLTDMAYTTTVLPVMLVTYYMTYVDSYLSPVLGHRHIAAWLWWMFPVWICVAQWVLAKYILPESTIKRDRLYYVRRDLPAIRITVLTLSAFSAAVWLYTVWFTRHSLVDVFVPVLHREGSFEGAIREVLKWDQAFFVLGNMLWVMLLIWDLKAADMVKAGWPTLLLCPFAVTIMAGNGAMLGLMWLWREEVLASSRHKDAVVYEPENNSNNEKTPPKSVSFSISREETLW